MICTCFLRFNVYPHHFHIRQFLWATAIPVIVLPARTAAENCFKGQPGFEEANSATPEGKGLLTRGTPFCTLSSGTLYSFMSAGMTVKGWHVSATIAMATVVHTRFCRSWTCKTGHGMCTSTHVETEKECKNVHTSAQTFTPMHFCMTICPGGGHCIGGSSGHDGNTAA